MKNNYITKVSIIVPCFNEEYNIELVYNDIKLNIPQDIYTFEIIFIDDGSTDQTLNKIISLNNADPRVKFIRFSRNFGHQKALRAGLIKAKGELAIIMDADLQHPAKLLPDMLRKWEEGYMVVNMIREYSENTSLFKKSTSVIFYKFINIISDIVLTKSAADFKLIDRSIIDLTNSCTEEYLFLRGLTSWCGFKQTSINYCAKERINGKSKYNLKKMLSLAGDGIMAFSIKPLRISIYFSLFFMLLCGFEVIYVLYILLFTNKAIPGWSSIIILISMLGAIILLMLGVIGEYLGKLFVENKRRPIFIIEQES